ncbi:MAG: type IV pilin-like G/H family protein [Cyanobacteria bacterium P01_E01_bin.6]
MKNDGFTLIELLVVIVIMGVLSAIAIPSFISFTVRARHAEARNYIGSINRAQQAHFAVKEEFADGLTTLGIGMPVVTRNYTYEVLDSEFVTTVLAQPRRDNLRGHAGVAGLITILNGLAIDSAVCVSLRIGTDSTEQGSIQNNSALCPDGFNEI